VITEQEAKRAAREHVKALRATVVQLKKDARLVMQDMKADVAPDVNYMKIVWDIENALGMIYPDAATGDKFWPGEIDHGLRPHTRGQKRRPLSSQVDR
jgi:hypothetical protein